jgi:predicted aspartyl protease
MRAARIIRSSLGALVAWPLALIAHAEGPAPEPPIVASTPSEAEPLYAASTREDRIGRILAPVTINGQGPYRFVFDTGASRSAVSPRLVETLGLSSDAGDLLLNGVTGSALVATVKIASLRAGGVDIGAQRLPVVWPPVVADADGILGMDGLAQKRIVVDFLRDRISIARSRYQSPASGSLVVPVRLRFGGLMLVDGRVGRVRVRAVIDTGAQRTLGNTPLQRALRLRGDDKDPLTHTKVIGATPDQPDARVLAAPVIRLGDAEVSQVHIIFADLHVFRLWQLADEPALIVGMDVLGTLESLVIDYRRKELHLRPRSQGKVFIDVS